MKTKIVLFWFRRDLRLEDNIGLSRALDLGFPVMPIFIFDPLILRAYEKKNDRRVDYIHQALSAMNIELKKYLSKLHTYYGNPLEVFKVLREEYDIQSVVCNKDYEPQEIQRDTEMFNYFTFKNIPFRAFKDQVIFDENDVVKNDGRPYTIYTPYSKKWKELLTNVSYKKGTPNFSNFHKVEFSEILPLKDLGFEKTDIVFKKPRLDPNIIGEYDKYRDYPALQGTTGLGVALRFGTISIRKCVLFANKHNQTWLNELIWREFFKQILYHFPKVVHHSFKEKYEFIQWRNDDQEFEMWCNGKTGYPLVDAGMRQLNETGYMHNRVRIVVASFLSKHLLIDWRWGEAYFAKELNDYDLSANNGNWQWAEGCGCDAAPYFRVFNPVIQTEKYDKNLEYIIKWVPEYGTDDYPEPIVEHRFARERALKVYRQAVNGKM